MTKNSSPAELWIKENTEKLIKLTQDLVRIPSISGKEMKIQDLVFRKFNDMDLNPKMVQPDITLLKDHEDFFETTSFKKYGYENRPNVAGVLKGSGKGSSICLSGHSDVVSAEPLDKWTRDPWGGEVEENYLYGRGAGDMKAGLAAIMIAVQALQKTDTILNGDVFLESTIEEEDGGVGGNLFMRMTQPKPDAAIIPEPSYHTIGIASAGVMYFRVIVPGIPAHAATAHFGVNAIHNMVSIIEALKKLHIERQRTISYPYVDQYETMKGKSTTINIGIIRAGDWPSTVPGVCEIECRVGWPPGETREQIINQIETTVMKAAKKDPWLKEHPPTVEWFGWRARPHEQDPSHPFVQLIKNEASRLISTQPTYAGGSAGLDTRYFAHQGIPSVVFGPTAERIHSFDERVDISSVAKVAEVFTATMIKWCGVD